MRILVWLTCGAAAACGIGVYFAETIPLSACLLLAAALLILCAVLSLRLRQLRPIAVALLGALLLFAWQIGFRRCYLAPAQAADGQTQYLAITLTDYSTQTDYGIRAEGVVRLEGKLYRVCAYADNSADLKPGDTLLGQFRLRVTTGGAEGATYHMGNGVFLLAYPKGQTYYRFAPDIPWYGLPAQLAAQIRALLEKIFPEDTLAFAQALLLGDTQRIDYETDTAFKLSGIRHIIAVSGLHVSILFSLVYRVTGRRKWLSVLAGIPVLVLFSAMAGFTPSIMRASIMHAIMLLATLFEREYDPPSALAFAVLVMLLGNPYAVTSVSLQLSAGCMCGIFLFSERIKRAITRYKPFAHLKGRKAKALGWFGSSIGVTLGATVATTPLCALYFHCVSLVGVLTNLLTLWVITFIFYGILLACAAGALWLPLGRVVAAVVSLPMRYVLWVARTLSALPLAAVYTTSVYIVIFLVFAYALLTIFLFGKRRRPVPLACCLVIALCLCLLLSWTEPFCDAVRVTVLDVGQGQCIVLQSGGKTFLVDCGGDSNTAAADTAAEMLCSMGVFHLDGIILTHYDRDHAGGVSCLLSRVDADCLYLPDCADTDGYGEPLRSRDNAKLVTTQLAIVWDDAKITLIPSDYGLTNNESGLCILFQCADRDILITGDRNSYGEMDLLRQIELPKLELLIVGHHGSKYSTCEALLAATQPDIAVISVGDNSYGHPTQEVLDRLTAFGCRIYRTDQMGTVIYRG